MWCAVVLSPGIGFGCFAVVYHFFACVRALLVQDTMLNKFWLLKKNGHDRL